MANWPIPTAFWARFDKYLIESGWWQRSLVVLLSDHGEGLGDHGEDTHGYFLYESTLHVPLIVHWPDGSPGHPARSDSPGGLIDVAPTVLDFSGIAAPPSFAGHSLLKASRGQPVYSESFYAHDSFGWSPLRSLREGQYKYIEAPHPELYNLAADPRELTNLYSGEPARAQAMRSDLRKLVEAHAPKQAASPAAISPRTRALLASLGYLSGRSARCSGRRDCPTRKTGWRNTGFTKGCKPCFPSGVSKRLQMSSTDPGERSEEHAGASRSGWSVCGAAHV